MADTDTLDLAGLLDSADLICERVTFGSGAAAFDVDIRRVDTRLLQDIGKKSTTTTKVNGRPETKADIEKFHDLLRQHCVADWHELTVAKLLTSCNRRVPAEGGEQVVSFTPANVALVLKNARGNVNGDVIGFDDFVFSQATRIGQEQAAAEAAAKND
jgi:hypothetical protein